MTTSTWLRVFAARTVGDEKMLTATVERLADMPAVSAWFADGTLSWPAVRGIVLATRNLTSEQRSWLDDTLAEDRQRICRLDADQVVAAAERLAAHAHPAVSATLRAALVVRDGGCRFPGCLAPVDQCENHHVTPIADGGPTKLTNLALICANHHHAIHDSGWSGTLHADGTMTFTRRGVTITSYPRAAQRTASAEPTPRGRPRRRRPPPTHTGSTTPADAERNVDDDQSAHAPRDHEPATLPF